MNSRNLADRRLAGVAYLTGLDKRRIWFVDRKFTQSGELEVLDDIGCDTEKIRIVELNRSALLSIDKIRKTVQRTSDAYFSFLISTRIPKWLMTLLLSRAGLQLQEAYLVIPGVRNPRWFVPNRVKAIFSSGNMIKPTRLSSRIGWNLIRLFSGLGSPQMAVPDQLLLCHRHGVTEFEGSWFLDYLREKIDEDKYELVLFTGAWGVHQKFTVRIATSAGQEVAFAKIAKSRLAKTRVAAEAETLKYLGSLDFEVLHTPRFLDVDEMKPSSDLVLLQGAPGREFDRWEKDLTELHVDALVELFEKTNAEECEQGIDELLKRLLLQLKPQRKILREKGFVGIISMIEKALDRLSEVCGEKRFTTGLSHGDFTTWNIYLGSDSVFVFDWEGAKQRLPMWDLFYYIMHREVLIYSKTDSRISKVFLDGGGRYRKLMDLYLDGLSTPVSLSVYELLAIFLCEVCIDYLEYCAGQVRSDFAINHSVRKIFMSSEILLDKMMLILEK